MRLKFALVISSFALGPAFAEDPPQTPPKQTIPDTGGYLWGSGPPAAPRNMPPKSRWIGRGAISP